MYELLLRAIIGSVRWRRIEVGVAWYSFCLTLGIAGGFLGAEFGQYGGVSAAIGLAIALVLPVLPVRLARRRNQGVPSLLTYCAGFEALPIWIGVRAAFPSPGVVYADPGATMVFGVALAAVGVGIAFASLLPSVRGRQNEPADT